VLGGVAEAARQRGANLVCFTGGILFSPQRGGAQRNHIYELAGPENVDALMLMSGTLGNYVGPEELLRYCERFRPLPLCSIAVELPGIPSVLVDNESGMRDAIVHLIKDHGYRRIAFIQGPDVNPEAERRYGVYRDVLQERGISLDPKLVVPGDFMGEGGREGVRRLLESNANVPIDAIVAANDQMALGALEELTRRGVRVPEQIALVGFDDIEEARFADPPLTTVRQPLREQGRRAVELVMAQLEGQGTPGNVHLRTELVTRRSCQCFGESRLVRTHTAPPQGGLEAILGDKRTAILRAMSVASRDAFREIPPGWEQRLLEAFVSELRDGRREHFIETFDDMLRQVGESGADVSACHDVLSALRRRVLEHVADQRHRALAEDLLQEARVLAAAVVERAQAQLRLRVERWARTLSETGAALMTTLDVAHLVETVAEQFPRLGITGCYLSLYLGDGVPAERSKLVLAFNSDGLQKPRSGRETFASRELAPRELLPLDREYAFVVEPLFYKQDRLGYALFELGPSEGTVYETLRDQVSAALKGTLLIEEKHGLPTEPEPLIRALSGAPTKGDEPAAEGESGDEMLRPLQELRDKLGELQELVTEYRSSAAGRQVIRASRPELVGEVQKVINAVRLAAERASGVSRSIHRAPDED
jgi:DNA-binding LacI/PurR family transcriptional regulator